ncbi:hypothetical protein JB92DRAFT_2829022 [Gautieria morchelliformis]|nr:hypothetical protein JB92DRAFT_2829022 [Gautieria morchelliformis]
MQIDRVNTRYMCRKVSGYFKNLRGLLRREERRGTCGSIQVSGLGGYGVPEAAVAKMLVYRMGRDVGKKDIWKIYEDAAQPLAPPWINEPRARALSRIRGYWIRVESAGQWKHRGGKDWMGNAN